MKISLDESALPRTGPKGWLLKTDVLQYIHSRKLVPQPQAVPLPPKTQPAPSASAAAPASAVPAAAKKSAPAAKAAAYQDLELTSMRKTIAKRLTEVGFRRVSWVIFICFLVSLYEGVSVRRSVHPSVGHTRVVLLGNGPNLNKIASGMR